MKVENEDGFVVGKPSGVFSFNGKDYIVKKRYVCVCYEDRCLVESDDLDFPVGQWSKCELLPVEKQHCKAPVMIVGSVADKGSMLKAILQAMDHEVICMKEASHFDFKLKACDHRLSEVQVGMLPEKKGRRKGQRKNNFPRR